MVPLVVREGAVCLVALRDGRCDNDDVTFDSIFCRSYTSGFYAEYIMWERSGSRGVVRGSRGRSSLGRVS